MVHAAGETQQYGAFTLAFHGCVYIGAYIAIGGAIQLSLTVAPVGVGRAAAAGDLTAAAAEDAAVGGLTPRRVLDATYMTDERDVARTPRNGSRCRFHPSR